MKHLSLSCLDHNMLFMELQLLLGLEVQVAQGVCVLPCSDHSEVKSLQKPNQSVQPFLVCNEGSS